MAESRQVVLVTGCSYGLGCYVAKMFAGDAKKRYKVWATVRILEEKGTMEEMAGSLLNDTLFIKKLDLTKQNSIDETVEQILKEDGHVDILVNNAGLAVFGPMEVIDVERARHVFEVNVFGHVRLMQLVIPTMKARRSGRILNISTISTAMSFPFMDFYVASKLALEGISECQASALRPFNIWVSVVQLTSTRTDHPLDIITKGPGTDEFADKNIDEATKPMLENWRIMMQKSMTDEKVQEPAEVAKFIQSIAETETPSFRYYPSPIGSYIASSRFCDPTGTSSVQAGVNMIVNNQIDH